MEIGCAGVVISEGEAYAISIHKRLFLCVDKHVEMLRYIVCVRLLTSNMRWHPTPIETLKGIAGNSRANFQHRMHSAVQRKEFSVIGESNRPSRVASGIETLDEKRKMFRRVQKKNDLVRENKNLMSSGACVYEHTWVISFPAKYF